MPNPNFFIVGAPKCGTTSLYESLRRHPDVFMPQIKEPAYFGSDLEYNLEVCARNTIQHRENYLKLFEEAHDFRRIGEASTWYLFSQLAAREIYEFDPQAKIIIMLRNPVDTMYSLHGEFLWNCNEDIVDFRHALAAQSDRRQGHRIPETAHFPRGLQYEEVVQFTDQVKRFLDQWGPEQVLLIIHDDYRKNTQLELNKVAKHLEIDPEPLVPPRRANASKPMHLLALNRFLSRRVRLRRAINKILPLHLNRRLRDVASKLLRSTERTRQFDPELRSELQEKMQPEIDALSELLDRDLTHWYRP